ncbi:hypothetical protein DFH07DRAFT_785605 [Mycena maculata]|uniref:Uncharacterized protein n=1 Tax=Mycena maculata TaxID=230809 RepID=A0AAD7H9R5_9AGAR|nr:hypothetical protein DFH07DRAFT_785605 [Mycena maculata]
MAAPIQLGTAYETLHGPNPGHYHFTAGLVSGECCCTFTLRIPFMTAVCAFYGIALHGPPLRIPEADATVREALAFFEESVGKSERYQSQGLLDVLYGVPYPNPEIFTAFRPSVARPFARRGPPWESLAIYRHPRLPKVAMTK